MSPFDFVTAVAMGAVIGRTVTASGTSMPSARWRSSRSSWYTGTVSLLRYRPAVRRLTDHRIRVLVANSRLRRRQLWVCGLTEDDLDAALRQQGLTCLQDVQFALYEPAGGITIVRQGQAGDLIDDALPAAANPPDARGRRPGKAA
jgi:uncharacterized membrane protein YcaP (DUF421 family)